MVVIRGMFSVETPVEGIIKIGNEIIERVEVIKYLGILLKEILLTHER